MMILVKCHDREMSLVGIYYSVPDARVAMYEDLVAVVKDKLDEQCADIIKKILTDMQFEDNFSYEDGSNIGVYPNSAWADLSDEQFDWRIF